jgi:hydrogenase nickel incorporation protein HypA/HybF
MHEMSIVEALLRQVRNELRPYPNSRVRSVRVRVGKTRLIEPEMLAFCYKTAVRDTSLADSRLEIEQVGAMARCDVCSLTFEIGDAWFECPRCHSTGAELLAGNELELTSIEVETGAN